MVLSCIKCYSKVVNQSVHWTLLYYFNQCWGFTETEDCRNVNFPVTGDTTGCHCDKLRRRQLGQIQHHDNSWFSVLHKAVTAVSKYSEQWQLPWARTVSYREQGESQLSWAKSGTGEGPVSKKQDGGDRTLSLGPCGGRSLLHHYHRSRHICKWYCRILVLFKFPKVRRVDDP